MGTGTRVFLPVTATDDFDLQLPVDISAIKRLSFPCDQDCILHNTIEKLAADCLITRVTPNGNVAFLRRKKLNPDAPSGRDIVVVVCRDGSYGERATLHVDVNGDLRTNLIA